MNLNPDQQCAVELDEPQIVVMSGPGSGKTRVAVERVKRLNSKSIVVLTFTNAAAAEFRRRTINLHFGPLGKTGIGAVAEPKQLEFCGTLHSYCFRLIRQFGRLIGYGHGNVALLPESDRMALFKEIRDCLKDEDEKVRAEYYFTLKQNNLVDYDKILEDGLRLLKEKEVRAAVACEHLIVEEAQDSAEIDWQIYEAIPALNRFVIGDVDQAIFEFRKAYPKGLLDLARHEDSTVIKLEQNYRCAKVICDAANKLIKWNESRFEKDTVSATGEEGEIVVKGFSDPWEELSNMMRLVKALLTGKRSVAVLHRTNYEVERTYDYLLSSGVDNVYLADRRDPWPADWRRAMLLIGFAASPYNEVIAEQLLKMDHESYQVDTWKLQAKASGTYLSDRLQKFEAASGILRHLKEQGVGQQTVTLIERRTRMMPADSSLSDLLADLYSNEQFKSAQPEGSVFLGTIHSAKGREFDVVFLPALEEVHRKDENMEEERRLMFVAVTRARSLLYISWAEHRKPKWGEVEQRQRSRFIGEMGL